jgi:F-type H+-transporting ATPase subunit delta
VSSQDHDALAERYSAALFDLAEQDTALPAVEADLKALKAMIAQSADLRRMLRSPALSRHSQEAALLALAELAGWSVLTRNFLGVVADNRRLFSLAAVIDAFLGRLAAHRGEVTAQVVSAVRLSATQRKSIAAALKKAVGQDVGLDLAVDSGLLGGMVISVGSTRIDASLATKLQQLALALKGVR